ncbi:major facilitator superfamily domain-containing protein 6-like [Anguilla rostrata]|uniref:major facilitator superfamily domain-containing protein 6-like n=1 Tax=Anguilla rostrata TaxID=7938 RepID=UPI0030CEFD70
MRRSDGQWDVRAASAHAGLFHFLWSCGRACLLPFLTLYLRRLGLTAAMVGIAMATRWLIALAWGPAASLLAARYDRRRAVVLGSLLCSAAVAPLLLLLPPADAAAAAAAAAEAAGRGCNATRLWGDADDATGTNLDPGRPGNFTHAPTMSRPVSLGPGGSSATASEAGARSGSNRSEDSRRVSEGPRKPVSSSGEHKVAFSGRNGFYSPVPERRVRSAGRGSKQGLEAEKEKEKEKEEEEEEEEEARSEFLGSLKVMDAQHQLFFLVLIGVALWEGMAAPLERTVDDGLYEYLDFVDAADRHGSARLWGLLGASGGTFGAGLLVAGLGCTTVGRLPSGSAHFFAYALLTALAVPAATFLPAVTPGSRKRAPAGRALKALRQVRRDPAAALCATTAFLAGAASSAVADFLLWQMQDQGSGELQMGVALGAALLSQVLFLALVAPRAARFLSHGAAAAAGAAALGLQCLYYSFLWSPWAALPAQALSCLSAGALWWAVEAQCEGAATPGTERWARAVARELAGGLGAALGSLAAGFTVDRFGAAVLFRGAAAVLLLWGLALPVVLSRLPRQRRINYSRLLAADGEAGEQSESGSDPEPEGDWLVRAMQDDRSANNNNNAADGNRHWGKNEKRKPV